MRIISTNTEIAPDSADFDQRLVVDISRDCVAPSPYHHLLVGFHFGSGSPMSGQSGITSIGVDPIDGGDLVECWWYKGDVEHSRSGNVNIAECAEFSVAAIQVADASPEKFRARTREAYLELLEAVGDLVHPHLVKIWNYFPDINGDDDDREKYRQFSIGRAEAFDKYGVEDATVPTGTAIGCVRDGYLTIIALTSKDNLRSAENPRQVSAFHYPVQYGPRSPKFSRGGCVPVEDVDLCVISGTAAIIGHESVHPYEVHLQIGETLENLDQLCGVISGLLSKDSKLVLDDQCVLRVYLRDPQDQERVASELDRRTGGLGPNVVYLNADICRRELMLEIDGTRVL